MQKVVKLPELLVNSSDPFRMLAEQLDINSPQDIKIHKARPVSRCCGGSFAATQAAYLSYKPCECDYCEKRNE